MHANDEQTMTFGLAWAGKPCPCGSIRDCGRQARIAWLRVDNSDSRMLEVTSQMPGQAAPCHLLIDAIGSLPSPEGMTVELSLPKRN